MNPNRDQAARDALDDLGVIEDDHTESLSAAPDLGEVTR